MSVDPNTNITPTPSLKALGLGAVHTSVAQTLKATGSAAVSGFKGSIADSFDKATNELANRVKIGNFVNRTLDDLNPDTMFNHNQGDVHTASIVGRTGKNDVDPAGPTYSLQGDQMARLSIDDALGIQKPDVATAMNDLRKPPTPNSEISNA